MEIQAMHLVKILIQQTKVTLILYLKAVAYMFETELIFQALCSFFRFVFMAKYNLSYFYHSKLSSLFLDL